jgi:hypothetical protein
VSRLLLILANDEVRAKAMAWIKSAPAGSRIEIKAPQRSLDQNSRFWALATDIASQATHNGRKYTAEQWRTIFLHALGKEVEFVPSLDGSTFLPLGQSSADLSKAEMSALMELMEAWAAENGVVLHYRERAAA